MESVWKSAAFVLQIVAWISRVNAAERVYYVAIKEIVWNYAPSGRDLVKDVTLEESEDASVFTMRGEDRIGRKYRKAVFLQYEDPVYETPSHRQEHWGVSGPPLRAEVGDVMVVHLKNFATFNYSIHPHGAFYEKQHEGALYKDGTNHSRKLDDAVQPGSSYMYRWEIFPEFGPAEGDPDCMTWLYHSHTEATADTNSGLVGPLLVCRPGSLDEAGNRIGIDKEFFFLVTVFDENFSWYLQRNIQEFCTNPYSVDVEDEDFIESNKMHSINGYVYGNLPGLFACKGDVISLHLFGVGTEADIHSIHFQGQTVIMQGHRVDTVSIFPGVFETAIMHADHPGMWKITCKVNDHVTAGMYAPFTVNQCGEEEETQQTIQGQERIYHIGIEETHWNYGPSGLNLLTGQNLTADGTESKTFFEKTADRIGGTYKKALYRAYEENFGTQLPSDPTFGILGPLIAAEIGDTIRVTLRNFASKTYNIEPSGVFFDDVTHLEHGEEHTYTWTVPDSVAPADLDRDCITYMYTSTVDCVKDTNSGLAGPILICRRGTLEANLARRAYYLLFTVFDENLSHYIEENIEQYATDPASVDMEDEDFNESNLMHSINGLMYTNLQGIDMCLNGETDFHLLGLGTEVDIHSVYFGSIPYKFRNENTNTVNVFPHTTATVTIYPKRLGSGELICGVMDHLLGGMETLYEVTDCGLQPSTPQVAEKAGRLRKYYIAAVDEIWDYFPWDEKPTEDVDEFIAKEKGRLIGQKYWKAIFYEYTDGAFTRRKRKKEHLGMLGPVISAEEGDEIEIVFRNMARRRYNIIPWGILDEAIYPPGPDVANPGQTVVYKWKVPATSVPDPNQPACHSFVYLSTVEVVKDLYTGLLGPLLICRKGGLSQAGFMKDADAEFFLSFFVIDESNSHYIDDNIREFLEVDPETFDKEDPEFVESNLMHGINGWLQRVDGLNMYDGDHVIWHLAGIGNEVDLHTVHFHAHAYNHTSDKVQHGDVFQLFPGKVGTVEMNVNAVGEWFLHCHVNDHMAGGMSTTYTVLPKEVCKFMVVEERAMNNDLILFQEKTRILRSCRARKRGRRGYKLHCSFKDREALREFQSLASDSIYVCVVDDGSDNSCPEPKSISRSHVYYMDIKCDSGINAEDFRDFVSMFPALKRLKADGLGLRRLEDDTFAHCDSLVRVYLGHNELQDIPENLFANCRRLRLADFRFNDLTPALLQYKNGSHEKKGIRRLLPLGSIGVINLKNNPRLGDDQGVYRYDAYR